MASSEMKFIISAVDNASQALSKVGKETEKLGSSTAKLNAASRIISAGAIIAFGAASVKAYAEAEKSQVRLEQAYRRFPALASVNIASLRELNSALQAKTGADDDQLAAAQATLAQFKLTGDQIKQLTPLLVDYATVTGQDVTTAAQSLGRAFMGNTRALKAIGIDFKATGDTAADFGSIMAALEGQVGGAGEAYGQTTAGQLQILQQSFSDLQEEVGAQLVPALKGLVAVAKPILGVFGQLPEPVKGAAVAVGALAAAALLAGPRVLELKRQLDLSGVSASKAGSAFVAAGKLLAVYTGLVIASNAAANAMKTDTNELSKSLVEFGKSGQMAGEALDSFGDGGQKFKDNLAFLVAPSFRDNIEKTMQKVVGALGLPTSERIITDEFRELDATLTGLVSSGNADAAAATFAELSRWAGESGRSVDDLKALLPGYTAAAGDAAGASGAIAGATEDVKTAADEANDAMSELKRLLDDLAGTQMDSEKAFMRVQDAIDKATDAANTNGETVDMNTEAGRANRRALQDLASSALEAASAYGENGESADTVLIKTQNARDAFIAVAEQMGISRDKAEDLATEYGLIPKDVASAVTLSGVTAAVNAANSVRDAINNIQSRTVTIRVNAGNGFKLVPIGVATGGYIANGRVHLDGGGPVSGPGTGTSDSIPAMLSNGEYVIRAAAVSRIGIGTLDDINDNGRIDKRVGLAGGGTPLQKFRRFVATTERAIEEEQELRDLLDARKQSATAMKGRMQGFASISNSFDTGAYAGAQADVASARERLNKAASPQEAAAARADLEAAERRAADSKPTAGNLVKGLRAKMRALTTFAADLKSLVAKKRIPTAILRDIIDAGPEEGGALAKALLTASTPELDELVKIQNQIDEASAYIGQTDANLEYNPQIAAQRKVVNRAVARAAAAKDEFMQVRTQVNLDGREIAEALANYKRALGGRKLGLD